MYPYRVVARIEKYESIESFHTTLQRATKAAMRYSNENRYFPSATSYRIEKLIEDKWVDTGWQVGEGICTPIE